MLADMFIHGHILKWLPQDPIMDGPRTQSDAVGSLGLAKWRAAIQQIEQISTGPKTVLYALH